MDRHILIIIRSPNLQVLCRSAGRMETNIRLLFLTTIILAIIPAVACDACSKNRSDLSTSKS